MSENLSNCQCSTPVNCFCSESSQLKSSEQKPHLFQKILQTLRSMLIPSTKEKTCPKLAGRFRFLKQKKEKLIKQLKEIKDDLQKKNEKIYSSFVIYVINPMLREANAIDGGDQQSIERMEAWTKKGKHCVQLYSKNTPAISRAVADHTIEQSFRQIDSDVKFIKTYAKNRLNTVGLSSKALIPLEGKIETHLNACLTGLQALKAPPRKKTLAQVEKWKVELNERRAKQIDRALRLIDEILHSRIH